MFMYLNVYKQMTDAKLLLVRSNTRNHLTVWKKNSFKNVIKKMCLQILYI